MKILEGKTALVTAAAQGIGRATVEAFAREGATVWATDIDAAKVEALASDSIRPFRLDVTDPKDIASAAARTGPLDILFNCAGYVAAGSLLESGREEWDRSFAINVTAMYEMLRGFLPAMIGKGGGSVINMASVCSSVKGIKDRAAYGATKAAVIGLTKSVAIDYIEQGIRCNAVCPGTVDTPSLQDRINAFDDPEAARKMFVDRQPMKRLAKAEEIAALCVYLASDAAGFVTGQAIVIDGGVSL